MTDLFRITSPSGAPFTVAKPYAETFGKLLADLEKAGYAVDPSQSGGYNPRNIAGTNKPSNHAFGRAIDVNWSKNARGSRGDIPADLARSLAKKHGLTWGGDWKNPDPMHFEIANADTSSVPVAQRSFLNYAGLGGPPAPASAPSTGAPSMPVNAQGQWVPEDTLDRQSRYADFLRNQRSIPHWTSIVAQGLGAVGGNMVEGSAQKARAGNQSMMAEALKNATANPEQAASIYGSSGVPGLAAKGAELAVEAADPMKKAQVEMTQMKLAQAQEEQAADRALFGAADPQSRAVEIRKMIDALPPDKKAAAEAAILSRDREALRAALTPTVADPNAEPKLVEIYDENGNPQKAVWNPSTRTYDPIGGAKAKENKDPKEYQTKDAMLAERMMRSNSEIEMLMNPNKVDPKTGKKIPGYDPTKSSNALAPDSGVIADMVNSAEWKQYQRAAREGIAAILRKDTGAAVTDQEFAWYFPMFYPQPNEDAVTVQNKARAREAAAQALKGSSGPAFDMMFPSGPLGPVPPVQETAVPPPPAPTNSATFNSEADIPEGKKVKDEAGNILIKKDGKLIPFVPAATSTPFNRAGAGQPL
jgi:hypothetical protein